MKKILITVLLLLGNSSWAETLLRFIGDVNFATDTKYEGSVVGGLSGLTFDPIKNQIWAISDDRGNRDSSDDRQKSRLYKFDIKVEPNFEITPKEIVYLKSDGKLFAPFILDPEGITILEDKRFLVSSEGLVPFVQSSLMMFDMNGSFQMNLPIPEKFETHAITLFQDKGVTYNSAFEALTSTPDKNNLYLGIEYSLKQDSYVDKEKNKVVRIIKYKRLGDNYIVLKEMAYVIDEDFGLVDFVATSDHDLFALERYYNELTNKEYIKIFQVDTSSASDISSVPAIKSVKDITPISKTLVLDVSSVVPFLDTKFRKLDNFEGITIGPKLSNGNDSLIIVSDNNFSTTQRTAFLAFEVIKTK